MNSALRHLAIPGLAGAGDGAAGNEVQYRGEVAGAGFEQSGGGRVVQRCG